MPGPTAIEQLQHALALHEAGSLAAAEAVYQSVLSQSPEQPDALHLLGLLRDGEGRLDEAQGLIERAIAASPQVGVYHLNLGNVLRRRRRAADAMNAWRRAAVLTPELAADAYANVAALAVETGSSARDAALWQRVAESAAAAQSAAATLTPDTPAAANRAAAAFARLAEALSAVGETAAAIVAGASACRLAPTNGQLHNDHGLLLMRANRPGEAAAAFRTAAAHLSDQPSALINLAIALAGSGETADAIATARRATELFPKFAAAHQALATLIRDAGRPAEAVQAARNFVAAAPASADAHDALGNALFDFGRADEAAESFRCALELDANRAASHSNLLMVMHYASRFDAGAIHDEHRRFAARHADPVTDESLRRHPHQNDRDPERRLRVGYISPDFRRHPVAMFFAPLLANHNRGAGGSVDVVLYSNSPQLDDVSARFRSGADAWRDITGMSDDAAAATVRNDRIDILVDLAGHTAHNRLLVLARKPAPVQATYIGYWNTTGMRAVDYRLTDAWNDPPGGPTEQWWRERLARIEGGAWCVQPPTSRPDVAESPAARDGFVTFISTNKLVKVSDDMLGLWRRILERSAWSRLLIVTGEDDARARAAMKDLDPARYELLQRVPIHDYFQLYGRADVLLDVAPHNGHTTTFDALWMGVPVLTIAGATHGGRLATSVQSAAGLESFVCASPDEYVERAVSMEGRIAELAQLRAGMRQRLLASPLTDGVRLARAVEAAYRDMWREWCATTR